MNWEWNRKSRDGKRFLHVGFGTADAVGTKHPASEIPIQEGLRLLIAKGIERWWMFVLIGAALRKLTHKRRRS